MPTNEFEQFASYPSIHIDQQTFLGASVRSFSANAGFGDTSSTLNVELVVDKGNVGDGTGKGSGQDVYHNGTGDDFAPPPAGSPVFFSMGSRFRPTTSVYKHMLDVYYNRNTASSVDKNHFLFGGILQSYVRTKSPDGLPLFSVALTDPREILANVKLVLNNFSGDSQGQSNILNVFGFLEKNTSDYTDDDLEGDNRLRKTNDSIYTDGTDVEIGDLQGCDMQGVPGFEAGSFEQIFGFRFNSINSSKPSKYGAGALSPRPYTGTGFSRRNERGIPFYRVAQGINALFGHYGTIPENLQGFGGTVKFRNLNYAVDLSDVPLLPPLKYIDYDSISLLDFVQEICDELNHEMLVVLLPCLDHPGPSKMSTEGDPAGVIKVITQDRSTPYNLTSIRRFITYLESQSVAVKSSDLGYEVNNSTTDKFVVGGNVVENHPVKHGSEERNAIDNTATWKPNNLLHSNIMPYYGLINNRGVTVPVGDGDYQQIMLDATGFYAEGVGNYYIATEMEMRAALKDYQTWRSFLVYYEQLWMEPIADGDVKSYADGESEYKVTVPRCAIPPINEENAFVAGIGKNPCHPPYGFPLYYRRASSIGFAAGSVVSSQAFNTKIISITGGFANGETGETSVIVDAALDRLEDMNTSFLTEEEKTFYDKIKAALKNGNFSFIEHANETAIAYSAEAQAVGKKGVANAQRVYNFVNSIARDCLGKKFLIRLPQTDAQDRENDFASLGSTVAKDFTFRTDQKLKVNKDPITNQFKYNYTPEPLGGYPAQDLMVNLGKTHMLPNDIKAISGSSGRILCYARFDNSQELDFSGFSKDTFTQEIYDDVNGEYESDFVGFDNTSDTNNTISSSKANKFANPKSGTSSTAFVKCTLDNKLYMPPAFTTQVSKNYYGGYSAESYERRPIKYIDKKTGETKTYQPADETVYTVTTANVGSIACSSMDLDYLHAGETVQPNFKYNTDCVYALITLPSRVAATRSSAYKNCEEHSNLGLKHALQADVVPLFSNPGVAQAGPTKKLNFGVSDNAPEEVLNNDNFDAALNKSMSNLTYSLPNKIRTFSPSPVYPDRTSIPLAHNHSYGPWLTNDANANPDGDIGGNVEFVKDESLVPWNYGGYKNMDSAGSTIATLGSSYQITSERGSITFASGPLGGYMLGQPLEGEGGPLITSINVDVSTGGIQTIYKMDLFTASFGKMLKSKQEKISRIGRLTQKLEDERNALERKDMGKNSTNQNYHQMQQTIRDTYMSMGKDFSNAESQASAVPPNKFTVTAHPSTQFEKLDGSAVNGTQFSSSVLSGEDLEAGLPKLANSTENLSRQYYNSVQCSLEDFKQPASLEPHKNMASKNPTNFKTNLHFYEFEDDYTTEQITYWRMS